MAFAWRDWRKQQKSSYTVYFENCTAGILAKNATAILTYAVDSLLQLEMCSVLKRVISSAILSLVLMLGLFIPIDNYSSGLKNSIYVSS